MTEHPPSPTTLAPPDEELRYEFWIDRGGTFTDCILLDHQTGVRKVAKVLSSDDAPLLGMRQLLGLPAGAPLPASSIRLGTTVATNALLERNGVPTALVITRGFADLLAIGNQSRPELFALRIEKPQNLYVVVGELNARLDKDGNVLAEPTEGELRGVAERLHEAGARSVAVSILHASANPTFERSIAQRLLAHWPSQTKPHITFSTELVSELGFLARTSTAVLDAYVTPLLRRYIESLGSQLPGSVLSWMQSSGGLAASPRFRGPQAVLSGPAGGIVAGEHIAAKIGSKRLITFDMGGTSTDVALITSKAATTFERQIAGTTVISPMLDIHTVAAGGGSVCTFDGYALRVGPESVGAEPGPICYGQKTATQVSLTDVNLVLGRLASDHFPFALHRDAAFEALSQLAGEVSGCKSESAVRDLCRSLAAVATTNMAEAIRTVTVQRGIDTTESDLLVFGGAAGQHACSVASALGIRRIFAHRWSGVLSAYGIGLADRLWSGQRDARRIPLDQWQSSFATRSLEELVELGTRAMDAEGADRAKLSVSRQLSLRYVGTETSLDVEWAPAATMRAAFEHQYHQRFGYVRDQAKIEVVAFRVFLSERRALDESGTWQLEAGTRPLPSAKRKAQVVLAEDSDTEVPVHELAELAGCVALTGPALLLDDTGTYLVEEGYRAFVTEWLLVIERAAEVSLPATTDLNRAARIQIVATRFASIAEQMGEALRRTASSTNIVDRLDFSCAVFDPQGHLVANAPHIPVHLGAMSESVAAVFAKYPHMLPGESYVTNDPAMGGSHLPDITVVTPIFSDDGSLLFFTASRGHHADVGGISPGSMPAFSRNLQEEGVVLSAEPLVQGGEFQHERLLGRLSSGPYPARQPAENIADLQAQLAANRLGADLLAQFCQEIGQDGVLAAMNDVRHLAATWLGDAIEALPDGRREFSDALDDGSRIAVAIEIRGRRLKIDFSGSDPYLETNLNAPRAVTVACVLYVLRTLLARPLPLNQGCLIPVELIISPRSLLDPPQGAPVASGNVETSQRIVDVLLGALDLCAASQGTMNNLSFGTSSFGYYETIAGGAGAGPDFDGASAVHTHMTNTRITDAEVLESKFPVRLLSFSVRSGSGGAGARRGGDGVVRELLALEDLEIALVTERRLRRPFGLAGGEPGAPGRNLVDGVEVPGRTSQKLRTGQTLRIETPGGGGYGPAA